MFLSRHKGRESLERDVALLLADPLAIQAHPHRHDPLFERTRERLLPESLFRFPIIRVFFGTGECPNPIGFLHGILFRDGAFAPGCKTPTLRAVVCIRECATKGLRFTYTEHGSNRTPDLLLPCVSEPRPQY
jgi:hypothetical protein